MRNFKEKKYNHELEFSEELSDFLNFKHINNKFSEKTLITTKHNKGNKRRRPDVTITQQDKILKINRQDEDKKLSNPFFIECKLGREYSTKNSFTDLRQIMEYYSQYIKFKYKNRSESHKMLKKYGDYNVVVTCPTFLTEKFNPRDFKSGWINPAQLIRTLWHLGLGILFKKKEKFIISFNEEEVLEIE